MMEYKFKGTPGKWLCENAICWNEAGHNVLSPIDNTEEEVTANERLIEASKDLLEACILALSDFPATDYKHQVLTEAIHKALKIKS